MEALAEVHWSYMDQFADRLILRGPTLSDDGTEHTGSVHVVDLGDRAGAERFARRAGSFSRSRIRSPADPWLSPRSAGAAAGGLSLELGYPAASSAKCAASLPTGTAACSPVVMSRTVTVPASSSALP
jgi:YCII-related domain